MLHDKDIREPLFRFLEETYGKIRILEEKRTGKSRADVVAVTEDALIGLEIKSDADTYERLPGQVKDYDKFYDRNYAVVGASHAGGIGDHIPAYWGIIVVSDGADISRNGAPVWQDSAADVFLSVLRMADPNPKAKLKNKMQILWRPELAMLQAQNGMPKYKDLGKKAVIPKILERTAWLPEKKGYIAPDLLHRQISDILFERDYTTAAAMVKEYRKSEMQKQIEAETDPEKRAALEQKLEEKKQQMIENGVRPKWVRRRRRRKKSATTT